MQAAVHLEADDLRNQHRHRLAEHCRFRLDSTNAPTEHAESVDHGGVRVGAHEGVGVRESLLADYFSEDPFRQILEIDLVDDPGVGRNDAEVVQRLLSPAQKSVALPIAAKFEVRVNEERRLRSVFVDLHRVIDDEIDWLQRIDQSRIATESGESVAHRGEIDDRRHASEVLEQNTGGSERNFFLERPLYVPAGKHADIVGFDELAVFVSEQIFEEDLEAEGEAICVPAGELGQGIQPKDRVLPTSNVQR